MPCGGATSQPQASWLVSSASPPWLGSPLSIVCHGQNRGVRYPLSGSWKTGIHELYPKYPSRIKKVQLQDVLSFLCGFRGLCGETETFGLISPPLPDFD